MDPLVDLIRLLEPKATLWKHIAAAGRWAVSFPKRDDLLFTSAVTGNCLILKPRTAPVLLKQGDFALIRTTTPFSFASDRTAKPIRSEDVFTEAKSETIRLGRGKINRVLLQGGKFLFHSANEQLLLQMLPALIHIRATDSSASRIQTLLNLNAQESLQPSLGSEFVVSRLIEVILVELLRSRVNANTHIQPGLLNGLATPTVSAALRALHQNVAHHWTLLELAHHAGVSRSSLAAQFQQAVGMGPIKYLSHWRIALARYALRQPKASVAEVAFNIGFQSASAFSTAFKRTVGKSPHAFMSAPSLRL